MPLTCDEADARRIREAACGKAFATARVVVEMPFRPGGHGSISPAAREEVVERWCRMPHGLAEIFASMRTRLRMIRHARRERLVSVRREMLGRQPVIAVTGSAAKTTTVKLLGHLLGGPPRIGVSMYANTARDVLGQFARMAPDTAAVVVEASEFPPGNLARSAAAMRPSVAVLTIAGNDHYTAFRGAEAVALEMATLARFVTADGIVVMNADDDNLRRAVIDATAPLVTFGVGPGADYRAIEVAIGPRHTLSLTCRHGGEDIELQTPFVGRHFHVPTLAAVAAAHRLGVPWPEIQARLAGFEPVFGRCSVLTIPDGPLFICDTTKAPAWSMASSVETLESFTTAPRRTLVLGTLSDYPGDSRRTYRKAWRHARERVDRAIFLRHSPSHVGVSDDERASGRAIFMDTVQSIAAHVQSTAIPGEVILLKGSCPADHLDRIAHDAVASVACWLDKCGLNRNCINCEWMRDPTPIQLRPIKSLQHKLSGRLRIAG